MPATGSFGLDETSHPPNAARKASPEGAPAKVGCPTRGPAPIAPKRISARVGRVSAWLPATPRLPSRQPTEQPDKERLSPALIMGRTRWSARDAPVPLPRSENQVPMQTPTCGISLRPAFSSLCGLPHFAA
jgi:hypothetical protein